MGIRNIYLKFQMATVKSFNSMPENQFQLYFSAAIPMQSTLLD